MNSLCFHRIIILLSSAAQSVTELSFEHSKFLFNFISFSSFADWLIEVHLTYSNAQLLLLLFSHGEWLATMAFLILYTLSVFQFVERLRQHFAFCFCRPKYLWKLSQARAPQRPSKTRCSLWPPARWQFCSTIAGAALPRPLAPIIPIRAWPTQQPCQVPSQRLTITSTYTPATIQLSTPPTCFVVHSTAAAAPLSHQIKVICTFIQITSSHSSGQWLTKTRENFRKSQLGLLPGL